MKNRILLKERKRKKVFLEILTKYRTGGCNYNNLGCLRELTSELYPYEKVSNFVTHFPVLVKPLKQFQSKI